MIEREVVMAQKHLHCRQQNSSSFETRQTDRTYDYHCALSYLRNRLILQRISFDPILGRPRIAAVVALYTAA
jgi:hypothetical protein